MKRMSSGLISLLSLSLLSLFSISLSFGSGSPIPCLGKNTSIPIDDAIVLKYKTTTRNQFLSRAHIDGVISDIYPDHNGHEHFQLSIGKERDDTIEIVYNNSFGQLPDLKSGMKVEVCGDYITSSAPTNAYPASPDGAILHWVHRSPKPKNHATGFLFIEGKLYGQGAGMLSH